MKNYFKESELKCKCPCGVSKFDADFQNTLNRIRHLYNKPIYITSGYRCDVHNKLVGGNLNSAHTKGLAVDIKCDNSVDRFELLKILFNVGITRIGISDKFVHVDSDVSKPHPVTWVY